MSRSLAGSARYDWLHLPACFRCNREPFKSPNQCIKQPFFRPAILMSEFSLGCACPRSLRMQYYSVWSILQFRRLIHRTRKVNLLWIYHEMSRQCENPISRLHKLISEETSKRWPAGHLFKLHLALLGSYALIVENSKLWYLFWEPSPPRTHVHYPSEVV